MYASDKSLIQLAAQASDPFLFLSKILSLEDVINYHKIPVSQDASASAYQIMSYLLLNLGIGRKPNLIPSSVGKIQDMYMSLMEDLKIFLKDRLNDSMYNSQLILSLITRKLVKSLFMPLVYGKTVYSMAQDIRKTEKGSLLSIKESYEIAVHCIFGAITAFLIL